MSSTSDTLMAMYQAMRQRLGHQAWWPGDTPLEICLGAILTQNTSWHNVERALDNLRREDLIGVEALDALSTEQLAAYIRPAGYYNIKAKRLKNFLHMVAGDFDGDIDALLALDAESLRERLLAVSGIGRETADSMVLYAARKPSFVVDAYTFRIMLRHGIIGVDDDYESIKELFESSLETDVELWNDYHAQLVAVGKDWCRPRNPRCDGCPLNEFPHDVEAGMDGF
jgi:endonuclease-3 related protein